jgi:predicted amidohydrolase YtcJ
MTSDDKPAVLTGTIYTGSDPMWAEAVAISEGRITAVGSRSDVLAGRGGVEVIDVGHGLVLPAFQDAHIHPLHGGLSSFRCNLHDLKTKDGYLEAIAAYARDNPGEEWIRGDGWAMDVFPGGTPRKQDLDRAVPDRPAFLVNRDGHGAWVNSRALELAQIDGETPDPADGRIERDENGPTGTLHEGAMDLVERIVPANTVADLTRALRSAQKHLFSLGITAWQDAWVTGDDLAAYLELSNSGELAARVVLSLLWKRSMGEEQIADLKERRDAATTGRMRGNTVKIFLDGVAENFTAAMTTPYLDAEGRSDLGRGLSLIEPELLKRYVISLDAHGFQVHFHAIGDRAVREGLDAIEAARAMNGTNDRRHHIAHIQVIHPQDITRFRELEVVANGQPFWACRDRQMTELTIPFLGGERAAWQYPFASLLRAGARLAFGSDWPVSTADPLQEIEVAATRVSPDDRGLDPLFPEERISVRHAIEAFTTGAAFVNHLDHATGSIEIGKFADLTVVDRNIFEDGSQPIGEARVTMTFVEGEIVYPDEARPR